MKIDDQGSSKLNPKPKIFQYMYRDAQSGQTRCKLCHSAVQNSGFLRLHLQKVHQIDIPRIKQQEQSKVQGGNINRQGKPKKQTKTVLPLPLPLGPRDWLNPFLQQVQQPSSQEVDEDKDEYKYQVHCTQFTDPLKFFQFKRYIDQELTEIKQQMSEMTNLYKIPAMVTLQQKDHNLDVQFENEKYLLQRTKTYFKEQQKNVKSKFNIYYWWYSRNPIQITQQKNIQENQPNIRNIESQKNQQQNQLTINNQTVKEPSVIMNQKKQVNNKNNELMNVDKIGGQSIEKMYETLKNIDFKDKSNEEIYQQLCKKQFKIVEVGQLKKQNKLHHQISEQNQQLAQKQNIQTHSQSIHEKDSNIIVVTHQQAHQNYQKLADSLLMLEVTYKERAIIVFFTHDWRLHIQITGVVYIKQIKQMDQSYLTASLNLYFRMIQSTLPKSFVILNNGNNKIRIKQSIQNICKNYKLQKIEIIQQNLLKNIDKNNNYRQHFPRQFMTEYNLLMSRMSQIYEKYKDKGMYQDIQLQLIKMNRGKQQLNNIFQQFLDPLVEGPKCYIGLSNTKSIRKIYKRISWRLEKILKKCNNFGIILENILYVVNRQNKLLTQIEMGTSLPRKPSCIPEQIRQLQNSLSPIIYKLIEQIYEATKCITHIKHVSPTLLQVYSAFRSQNNKNMVNNIQTGQSYFVFKHLVMYNEVNNFWNCNCAKLVQIGLPCSHLLLVLIKMKASILYYVHSRWKPCINDLKILEADYNAWKLKLERKQNIFSLNIDNRNQIIEKDGRNEKNVELESQNHVEEDYLSQQNPVILLQ